MLCAGMYRHHDVESEGKTTDVSETVPRVIAERELVKELDGSGVHNRNRLVERVVVRVSRGKSGQVRQTARNR